MITSRADRRLSFCEGGGGTRARALLSAYSGTDRRRAQNFLLLVLPAFVEVGDRSHLRALVCVFFFLGKRLCFEQAEVCFLFVGGFSCECSSLDRALA